MRAIAGQKRLDITLGKILGERNDVIQAVSLWKGRFIMRFGRSIGTGSVIWIVAIWTCWNNCNSLIRHLAAIVSSENVKLGGKSEEIAIQQLWPCIWDLIQKK